MRRPRPRRGAQAAEGPAQDIEIVDLGGEGDGVVRGGGFAPFALPGERARAVRQGDAWRVEAILEPSPDRIAPACGHFGLCGGCTLQHLETSAYLAWKTARLRATLALDRIETEILTPFAVEPGARRRVALHARPGERGGPCGLGYKRRKSWDLTHIHECPVARPEIVTALPALAALAAPLFEHPKSAPTLHVTWTPAGLDVDITGVEARSGGLSADRRMRLAEAAAAADLARVNLGGEIAYLARTPVIQLGPAGVALPPGAFLQASAEAEEALAAFATEVMQGATRIGDLFCGVGTFTFRLAAIAPVLAADAWAPGIAALGAARAGAPGLKAIEASARDLARRPILAEELKRVDAVLFDPPRAGAVEQTREIARSKVSRVVGVSCNPATFARDARILIDAGFRLERVLPVDQFLWSAHLELAALFSR